MAETAAYAVSLWPASERSSTRGRWHLVSPMLEAFRVGWTPEREPVHHAGSSANGEECTGMAWRVSGRRSRPAQLGRVPACPRRLDYRLRLFHGRDDLARTAVCALLPRAQHAACAFRRLHREPRRTLDSPASAAACLVTLRASNTSPVPDPRPRQQIQSRLRRGLPQRRRRDHPHPVSRTEGKRVRRTLGRHHPPRLPRLAPDQQPQAA